MRSRTELVTTTLPGSENEEEASDLDDSEEDWKPVDKKKNAAASKVAKASPKTAAKRKAAAPASASKGRGKAAPKKSKKEESEDEEEDEEDDDEEEDLDEEDEDEEESSDGKKKTAKPKAKKVGANNIKSFPDKDGKFELFLFKNDLAKDFKNDPKLCMWRRDGSSLLQKYIKVKQEDGSEEVEFTASSVYSCWEEKRKHDFFQIQVQCIGEKKDGKVKVVNVAELAKFAAEDRPKIDVKIQDSAAANNEEDEEEVDGDEEEEEEDGEEDEDVEEEE